MGVGSLRNRASCHDATNASLKISELLIEEQGYSKLVSFDEFPRRVSKSPCSATPGPRIMSSGIKYGCWP
eukprot:365891-Chlamydomonas_euryale.AAC.10